MTTQRTVLLDGLGLCEHCGILLTIEDAPADAIDAEWRCPKCEGVLTNKSFGYEKIDDKWQKTQWVGKNGQWAKTKPSAPTNEFILGAWRVLIERPPTIFF